MELSPRRLLSIVLSACLLAPATAVESFRKPTVDFTAGNGSFLLAGSSPASIHVDAADWPGVLRAAHDLAIDFGRVTKVNGTLTATGTATANASMIFNVTGISSDWSAGTQGNSTSGTPIIVGTIGNSSLIDGLVASGKLDVSAIEGQWEAYVSALVQNPMNGTEQALVIAGKLLPSVDTSTEIDIVQEAIVEVQSTVSMMFPSKSVSLPGTSLPTYLRRATLKSSHSTPSKSQRRLPSSTAVSSLTMRHLP